jgi:hypothetical protein
VTVPPVDVPAEPPVTLPPDPDMPAALPAAPPVLVPPLVFESPDDSSSPHAVAEASAPAIIIKKLDRNHEFPRHMRGSIY